MANYPVRDRVKIGPADVRWYLTFGAPKPIVKLGPKMMWKKAIAAALKKRQTRKNANKK